MQVKRNIAIVLLGLVLFGYFFQYHPRQLNTNERSRMYLILAMVEDRSFTINRQVDTLGNLLDRSERNGKFYSDKAPGLSFMGAAALALVRPFYGFKMTYGQAFFWVKLLCVMLPSALLLVFLNRRLHAMGVERAWADLLTLVYAAGTLAFSFSTLFFGHQLSAVLLFGAFLLLSSDDWRPTHALAAAAGLMLGHAVITEYPDAVAAALIGVVFLTRAQNWRRLPALLAGGAVPVLLAMCYNHACFGGPLAPGYEAHSNKFFREMHAHGFFGLTWPKAEAAREMLINPAIGLLAFSPVLLLWVPGIFAMTWRKVDRSLSVCFALPVTHFFLMTSFEYWMSGGTVGPRHLTPIVPFMIVPIACLAASVPAQAVVRRWVILGAGAMSAAVTVLATVPYPLFVWDETNPILQKTLPLLKAGFLPPNLGDHLHLRAGYTALPFVILFGGLLIWLLWRAAGEGGRWARGAVVAGAILLAVAFTGARLSHPPGDRGKHSEAIEGMIRLHASTLDEAHYRLRMIERGKIAASPHEKGNLKASLFDDRAALDAHRAVSSSLR